MLYGIQLKTADFQHQIVRLFPLGQIGGQRGADVAAHKNIVARIFKHLSQKSGYGGLSVCAGNGNHGGVNMSGRQFHFPHNGNFLLKCCPDKRCFQGSAGAQNNGIGTRECLFFVPSGFQCNAQSAKFL